jgi:hypothetical protein
MSQIEPLSQRAIFRFWYPLSATWLMMAAEGPLLTSLIARLDDPKHNLAAYGVATAIAMIIESPIIMMLRCSKLSCAQGIYHQTEYHGDSGHAVDAHSANIQLHCIFIAQSQS